MISQLPPPIHGSTVMTAALIDGLESSNVETSLLDKRFSRTIAEVGSMSPRKAFQGVALLFRLAVKLIFYKPTHVVFFCTNRPASFVVDWALSELLRIAGSNVLNYIHTQGFVDLAARGAVWGQLVRRLLTSASLTVCLSPILEKDIEKWVIPRDRISIANTTRGVPVDRSASKDDQTQQQLRVLYLSNLIPEKGARTFVRLAISLLDSGASATFSIVGESADQGFLDGLHREIAASAHSEYIRIEGAADSERKWNYLRSADLLVFPSTYRFEAQPLTLIEALAVGTPAVAFDIGGISDLIIDGVTGYVVAADDFEALRGRVLAFIGDQSLLRSFSEAATSDFSARFSFSTFTESWLQALADTSGNTRIVQSE